MERKYYEAYDDRYRQVHGENLVWFTKEPSPIVAKMMDAFGIGPEKRILEIGCGEGRDARYLLGRGCDLLATDISPEAVAYCRELCPGQEAHFQVLNCIGGRLKEKFDFIYAVAVVHMLVLDEDRDGFYRFVRQHLKPGGVALICTMGDGEMERSSDIRTAFELQERCHEQTGRMVQIAGTSCRMVSFDTFGEELKRNGLQVLRQGMTAIEPDFPQMMYAVVGREDDDGHSSH
ncbi:MAG: methyltransferase domain-containing protein [Oscillospiraceae bacterium]|nr:methyltransferase domain-containing protein [Oscillospiraceae bacterium]